MKPIISEISLKIPNPCNGQYKFVVHLEWGPSPVGILMSLLKFKNNAWHFEDQLMLVSFYDIPLLLCQTEPIEFKGWNIMSQLLQL